MAVRRVAVISEVSTWRLSSWAVDSRAGFVKFADYSDDNYESNSGDTAPFGQRIGTA
jgi:hypothetical protein